MRLFLGIAMSPEAATALAEVRERFAASAGSDVRWSRPEGWHVTLQFLGQVTEQQAGCVIRKMAELSASRVPVRIEGLGFFERAGIFYAGVQRTPELLELQQEVTAANCGCGFEPEAREYRPHITLARARSGTKAISGLKKSVQKAAVTLAAQFVATDFVLYESFPGPGGSRYEAKARFGLGPGVRG